MKNQLLFIKTEISEPSYQWAKLARKSDGLRKKIIGKHVIWWMYRVSFIRVFSILQPLTEWCYHIPTTSIISSKRKTNVMNVKRTEHMQKSEKKNDNIFGCSSCINKTLTNPIIKKGSKNKNFLFAVKKQNKYFTK